MVGGHRAIKVFSNFAAVAISCMYNLPCFKGISTHSRRVAIPPDAAINDENNRCGVSREPLVLPLRGKGRRNVEAEEDREIFHAEMNVIASR